MFGFIVFEHFHPSQSLNLDVDANAIRAHMQFLSQPLLGGRAPGTDGELLAASYLAAQMQSLDLQPAGDSGSYIQEVQLVGSTVTVASNLIVRSPTGDVNIAWFDDFVATTGLPCTNDTCTRVIPAGTQFIFVGYGISAPEYSRNDWQGVSCAGRVALVLVGQPQDISDQQRPAGTLAYYARWTYKYEEARRQGCAGALVVHQSDAAAGYGWAVVQSSNTGEQIQAGDTASTTGALLLEGWLSATAANLLASFVGQTLTSWIASAETNSFKPSVLSPGCDISAPQSLTYATRRFVGHNVVGVLPASSSPTGDNDDDQPQESVVVMGHLDHLGTRNGQIYAGAVDNASGAGMAIELARSLIRVLSARSRSRALIVLNPTAEESGLLGSAYFTRHAPVRYPINSTLAAVCFDIGNMWGATRNMVVLGAQYSSLNSLFSTQAAALYDMSLANDPVPSQGMFFRSDHFSFARANVPAVWVSTGTDFIGQSADFYNTTVQGGYFANDYHRPSDVYHSSFSMDGAVQQIRVAGRVLVDIITNRDVVPRCTGGSGSSCF
eukprot:gnl/Spiro4/23286_TR11511_c0_g2_i1.p1 gnl/Spiro4/23286_TR11511_c0_g2~~gnl/Spiro4/23286_TR11511_c0_g2_i1.p1  ORF type:complete len:552 (-),score=88.65 gnl/Spiro4/23286_TR11511_c0_g2_i1:134-1789(-)